MNKKDQSDYVNKRLCELLMEFDEMGIKDEITREELWGAARHCTDRIKGSFG